jgi:MFS family permease
LVWWVGRFVCVLFLDQQLSAALRRCNQNQPHLTPPQIPGGWAAQIYGGRVMLIISFALWSLASLLTPGAAPAGATGGIVAVRVAVGVAQGFLIPSIHTVLSQWIPPHERARAVSLTTSGEDACVWRV